MKPYLSYEDAKYWREMGLRVIEIKHFYQDEWSIFTEAL